MLLRYFCIVTVYKCCFRLCFRPNQFYSRFWSLFGHTFLMKYYICLSLLIPTSKPLLTQNPKYLHLLQFSLVQSTTSRPVFDFSAYLKACYCEGPGTFLQDSFWKGLEQSLSTLKLSDFIGAVSQTLIYLKSFVETFCSVTSIFLRK